MEQRNWTIPVARAKAANVSMIKFTHRSCTAVKTELSVSLATAEMKVRTTAVIFTVTWNCKELALLFQSKLNGGPGETF